MEEHKSQELEEASRVQFRAPFLEPESEAVRADEAAEAGSGNAKGKLLRNMSRMLGFRCYQEEVAVNRSKIAGASGRFFTFFRVSVLGTGFWGR